MALRFNPFTGTFDNDTDNTTVLDGRYVNVTGDTMTGDLIIGNSSNELIAGYLRVGSTSAPTNTTAGDLTATRIMVGTQQTLASALQLGGTSNGVSDGITFGTDTQLYRGGAGILSVAPTSNNTDAFRVVNAALTTRAIRVDTTNLRMSIGGNTAPSTTLHVLGDSTLAGNATASGYLRVGSNTAPNNTTAGDLTALRLRVGDNAAFSAGGGWVGALVGTLTDTASGAAIFFQCQPTFTPTSNSSSEIRALNFDMVHNPGTGITSSTLRAGVFTTRVRGDGAITTLTGVTTTAATIDSGSASALSMTTVGGFQSTILGRPSGSSTATMSTGFNYDAIVCATANILTATTIVGYSMTNPAANAITTLLGIAIPSLTRGSTSSIAGRFAFPGIGTGHTAEIGATTDATAIQIPTASVGMGNQTATTTNAFGVHIGIATYTSTTNTRTITNLAGLYIAGAPVASTNVTATNGPYSIWVDAGSSRFDGDNFMGGYLRVGATTAPTNTTAGDLTAVRLKVVDGAFGTGVEFSVTGDGALSGFLRVGSETAPSNTTAGDLTFVRGFATSMTLTGRQLNNQGADVASANNLSLGTDGNVFEITGTTQINLISNTSWQNGSMITLLFTSNPTVKHNQATSSTNITIQLAGAADFAATAGDTLTLVLSEIGGTQAWREVARAVI